MGQVEGEGLKGGHLWDSMPLSCGIRFGKGGREKEGQAYSHSHALNVKCPRRLLCLMMSWKAVELVRRSGYLSVDLKGNIQFWFYPKLSALRSSKM